jgi:phospholipid/cholesterol/gamma-HCH transport system substrate-binding protein
MHRPRANPLLSGAVAAVLLGAVMVAVVFSGIPSAPHIPLPWSQTMTLHVQLADADALQPHASVEIAGVKVGEVQSVAASGDTSLATVQLQGRYSDIHDDAIVFLRPHGLFGPKYIDIVPGTAGARLLRDGDTIRVAQTVQPVDLDAILQDLQAPEQQKLRTAIVELGKAAAARGDDVHHLLTAADSLAQVLDTPLQTLDSVSPQLSDLIVKNESFNASFQHAPLDRLVANSEATLRVFAANAGHVQSILVNADTALSDLEASLNGEAGNLQAALHSLGRPPQSTGQTPGTADKLTRFTYLLGLFGANLTGRDTSDPLQAGHSPDVTQGIISAIENVRSAFAAYDTCTPGVNHCPASGPLAGQAHYLRVQVFNFPPGGAPSSSISLCGLPILNLPGVPSISCPAAAQTKEPPAFLAGNDMASFSSLFAS